MTRYFKWLVTATLALPLYIQAENSPLSSLEPLRQIQHQEDSILTIAMVYQPACRWCKKQGQSLAKIHHQCQQNVAINLIGHQGDKRQLKTALKNYDHTLPAFIATREFLTAVGDIDASPTLLFFDAQGKLIAKRRGFVDANTLFSAVEQVTAQACKVG